MDWSAAIEGRQVVRFTYDGLERIVQPATFGTSTAGNLTVRGCQVGGLSNRGVVPDWRPFTVAKIVAPGLVGEVFDDFTVPGYTTSDSMFASIVSEH